MTRMYESVHSIKSTMKQKGLVSYDTVLDKTISTKCFKKVHPISQVGCIQCTEALKWPGRVKMPHRLNSNVAHILVFQIVISILNGQEGHSGFPRIPNKDIANCSTINQSPFSHSMPISAIVVGLTFAIISGYFFLVLFWHV